MTINLQDFFTYYTGTAEQKEAIALLQQQMPHSLMTDDAAWVVQYRKKPEAPAFPITREQMLAIMCCDSALVTQQVMVDYANCVEIFEMDTLSQVYFLGQCGHESGGLRWPVELADGTAYNNRSDLGNGPTDGPKYKGAGYLQMTGRYNYQQFSNWLEKIGKPDPKVMELGCEYVGATYPWTASGFWWLNNQMNTYCSARKECTNYQIDEVGARVNGQMRPRGADERIKYTDTAYRVLIGV